MLRHSYVAAPLGYDVVAEDTEEGGRELLQVLRLTPQDCTVDPRELVRLLCFLLDALAVRDAEGLAPADWVEIGSDEEDEADLYAEAYDAGFRDGSAEAFNMVAEGGEGEADFDDEDLEDDGYYGYGNY